MQLYRFERHRPRIGALSMEVEVIASSEVEAEAKAKRIVAREYCPCDRQHLRDRYVLVEVWPAFGLAPNPR